MANFMVKEYGDGWYIFNKTDPKVEFKINGIIALELYKLGLVETISHRLNYAAKVSNK